MSDAKDDTAPDLDAWRAEAGEAAVMAATATPGPWCFDGYSSIDSEPTGSTVCQMPRPRSGGDIATIQGQDDAHFASAARTGWPRDAARVAALCAEVERLRAALAVSERAASLCAGEVAELRAEAAAAKADREADPCPGSRRW